MSGKKKTWLQMLAKKLLKKIMLKILPNSKILFN
jgi:hypothetical protein